MEGEAFFKYFLFDSDERFNFMNSKRQFFRRIQFSTIESTQKYAKKNAIRHLREEESGIVYIAEVQTGGVGRVNHKWHSPKGNIYATYCMKVKESNKFLCGKKLPQTIALVVKRVLDKVGVKEVRVKWTNDVFVKDSKICGILCEKLKTQMETVVLIGIGMNVNMDKKKFSAVKEQSITSVEVELGQRVDLGTVLDKLDHELHHKLSIAIEEGYGEILKEVNDCLAFKGDKVQVLRYLDGKVVGRGILKCVDDNGNIVVGVSREEDEEEVETFCFKSGDFEGPPLHKIVRL